MNDSIKKKLAKDALDGIQDDEEIKGEQPDQDGAGPKKRQIKLVYKEARVKRKYRNSTKSGEVTGHEDCHEKLEK